MHRDINIVIMFEFPIDLLIKQNLRSVVFDSTNMGIMSSRAQQFQSNLANTVSKEAAFCNLLRSPETIKWLFERPNEYMYKIFENVSYTVTSEGICEGLTFRNRVRTV